MSNFEYAPLIEALNKLQEANETGDKDKAAYLNAIIPYLRCDALTVLAVTRSGFIDVPLEKPLCDEHGYSPDYWCNIQEFSDGTLANSSHTHAVVTYQGSSISYYATFPDETSALNWAIKEGYKRINKQRMIPRRVDLSQPMYPRIQFC